MGEGGRCLRQLLDKRCFPGFARGEPRDRPLRRPSQLRGPKRATILAAGGCFVKWSGGNGESKRKFRFMRIRQSTPKGMVHAGQHEWREYKRTRGSSGGAVLTLVARLRADKGRRAQSSLFHRPRIQKPQTGEVKTSSTYWVSLSPPHRASGSEVPVVFTWSSMIQTTRSVALLWWSYAVRELRERKPCRFCLLRTMRAQT